MTRVCVHHLEKSRSTRALWLLEELGVPYEMKLYQRHAITLRAPPELRAIHPLGKSPVVEVDGVVLAESGAIIELLLLQFGAGRLRPEPGSEEFRRYLFFLHFAEGSMMLPLFVALLMAQIKKARMLFFIKPIARGIADNVNKVFTTAELSNHLAFVESELKDRLWLTGAEFTAADIQMSYPLAAALHRAGQGTPTPHLHAYLQRTQSRPAFVRALARGGPLMGF